MCFEKQLSSQFWKIPKEMSEMHLGFIKEQSYTFMNQGSENVPAEFSKMLKQKQLNYNRAVSIAMTIRKALNQSLTQGVHLLTSAEMICPFVILFVKQKWKR